MDECEVASMHTTAFINETLSKHQQASQARQNYPQAHYCEDCDKPIPEARIKAVPGTTRCVMCQEYFENTNSR